MFNSAFTKRKTHLILLVLISLMSFPMHAMARNEGMELISIASDGTQGDFPSSTRPSISADGRFVVFHSTARNLDPINAPNQGGIALRDRQTGTTKIVSVDNNGVPMTALSFPSISPDGNYVAFRSNITGTIQVYVRDLQNNTTELVSLSSDGIPGDGFSGWPSFSADGRFVAFQSSSTNLAPGEAYRMRVYLRDRLLNTTTIVSDGPNGIAADGNSEFPQISGNGRYVVFSSSSRNLVEGIIPTNGRNIYVHDRDTGTTEIVSINNEGVICDGLTDYPAINFDGRFIVFQAYFTHNLANTPENNRYIYLHDRDYDNDGVFSTHDQIGAFNTEIVSVTYTEDQYPTISADGRIIAFSHYFMSDQAAVKYVDTKFRPWSWGEYVTEGAQDQPSVWPVLSSDGRLVAFSSKRTDLVPLDTNGSEDIFLRDLTEDYDNDGYDIFDDCNDRHIYINPGATEIPYNGTDENCNGMADNDDLDQDGFLLASDCNDNAAAINPGAAEVYYNGVDENCSGMADDDDVDGDGFLLANDCDDNAAAINPGALEIPYNGVDENCNGMADDVDFDSDGYDFTVDCNDNSSAINPGAAEIYNNGIDENCSGMADDIDGDNDNFDVTADCNDADASIFPGAAEIKFDAVDQDCNGYDLTIEITEARYTGKTDELRVKANSILDGNAALNLDAFGAMNWTGNRWELTVSNVGGSPGSITISGIEGSESEAVTVK